MRIARMDEWDKGKINRIYYRNRNNNGKQWESRQYWIIYTVGGPERPPLTIVSTYNEQDGTL
jgi:hypothetical protein